MIGRWWTTLLCRFAGRKYSRMRPSSKDLIREMRARGRRVDVKTFELKQQRNVLEQAFLADRRREEDQ